MTKFAQFFKKMPEFTVLMLGWVGFLLWLLSPMAQAVELPSVWETMDKQAYDEYQKGHIEAAEDLFEDPVWHGVTLYKLGRYQEAINEFKRVKTALSRYNLGNSYAQLGQFAKAKQAYEDALKRHPSTELKTKIEQNLKLMEKLLTPKKQPPHTKQPSKQSPKQSKQPQAPKQTPQKAPSKQKQGSGQSSANNSKGQNREHQQGKEGKKADKKQAAHSAGQTASQTGQTGEKNQGIQTQDTDKALSSKDAQKAKEPIKLGKDHPKQHGLTQGKGTASGTEAKPLSEQQQAQQTWLNQIPDEPERFIQRKFEYQYQQQSRQPNSSEPKKIW